jgi:dienelactone hydrolase
VLLDGFGVDAGSRTSLSVHRSAAAPRAAVLVLHGGRSEGPEPPTRLNLPARRMRPVVRAVCRSTDARHVLVGSVRYTHRGWNGDRRDAACDADRALEELLARTGLVPVVLVGHSMGGRAALAVGGRPQVRGVVGLAPWCPLGEPVDHLRGTEVVLVHGDRDRMTDPRGSQDFVHRAHAAGVEARYVPMHGGDHAMLRTAGAWHRLTADLVTGMLRRQEE